MWWVSIGLHTPLTWLSLVDIHVAKSQWPTFHELGSPSWRPHREGELWGGLAFKVHISLFISLIA